jgi:nicotinamide-nucleotide amidase
MMHIEIIAIASEVLSGRVVNTNASFISQTLLESGFDVSGHTVLPDDPMLLKKGLTQALKRSELIIVTGGLGPTCDDITRSILAELFDSKIEHHPEVFADLSQRFGHRNVSIENQAQVPKKAQPILNTIGTAPGLIFTSDNKCLIALPGVPIEMKKMLLNDVIPYLKQAHSGLVKRPTKTLNICILSESAIDPLVRELSALYPSVSAGIYPAAGVIRLVLSSSLEAELTAFSAAFSEKFETYIFPAESGKIEEAIHNWMIEHQKTLAFAESCTGGLLSAHITALAGASNYFLGSLVVYSNDLKIKILGVSEQTLSTHGAVSRETVSEMIAGVFRLTNADYAIVVSGIAGPEGGSADKPVGTVWAAIGHRGDTPDIALLFAKGNREAIILSTTNRLLGYLWRKLVHQIPFVID